MTRSLLVVAPHPDDEILGAGGLLARAASEGRPVGVLMLTDGGASDPAVPKAELIARRAEECRRGLAALLSELPPLMFVGEPDGELDARRPPIGPGSPIATFCEGLPDAEVIVTDPADGHLDHKASFGFASRLVAAGLIDRLTVMPVSQRVDGVFDAAGWQSHPVAPSRDVKRAALQAHASQLDSETGFAIPAATQADVLDTEYLRPVFDRRGGLGRPQRVEPGHFDALFTGAEDPWAYDTSPYEQDRFARTIAALDGRRFSRALELGCANGALTRRLAPHCDSLIATDGSTAAVALARRRLGDLPNVEVRHALLPGPLPGVPFDLIVASDFLYYLGIEGIATLMGDIEAAAAPDARLVIVNYLGETECALSGEMAAETALAHAPGWRIARLARTDKLRIERLDRA